MSFKTIVRELKPMKNGIGSISESKHWLCCSKSHVAPDVTPIEPIQQGQWANLPPDLLLDIIQRVEESETSWPARSVIVSCASVCRSWRSVTKEIMDVRHKRVQHCGRITFPISVKQPGPRDYPIQCFIRRNIETNTFVLYLGLVPSEHESNKLLLAAKMVKRISGTTEFVISLATGDFSQGSNNYIGKLRSNFWSNKFTIYDNQPPHDAAVQPNRQRSRRFNSKKVSPIRVPPCSNPVSTISYELNGLFWSRGLRKVHCVMNSIPISSIQEGGNAPTPTALPPIFREPFSPSLKEKRPTTDSYSGNLSELPGLSQGSIGPLILKNKAPIWDEQRKGWCLNFMGRVTVPSVQNFQLVADVDPSHNVSPAEQERVILLFGKIGKDIFTMDYSYPLSAFQAFAICLTSFHTEHGCDS